MTTNLLKPFPLAGDLLKKPPAVLEKVRRGHESPEWGRDWLKRWGWSDEEDHRGAGLGLPAAELAQAREAVNVGRTTPHHPSTCRLCVVACIKHALRLGDGGLHVFLVPLLDAHHLVRGRPARRCRQDEVIHNHPANVVGGHLGGPFLVRPQVVGHVDHALDGEGEAEGFSLIAGRVFVRLALARLGLAARRLRLRHSARLPLRWCTRCRPPRTRW